MFIQNNEEESDIRWGHKEQNASSDQKKREKVEVHQQTANQHKFNRSQKNKEKVEDYPLKNKSFAPIPSSSDRFARQNHYGPTSGSVVPFRQFLQVSQRTQKNREKVEVHQQTNQHNSLTTCLADKTNHPVERLSLNRSQCGSCSTKYDTSAGT